MDLDADIGSFGQLATAIGLLDDQGQPNSSWFGDPVGSTTTTGNQHGLRHLLGDDAQRDALLGFVDEVLGAPDRADRAGRTWVPLFRETDPQVTVFAVVEDAGAEVHLGVGLEHSTTGPAPRVATRVHVPLFTLATRGNPAPAANGTLPGWLLLGRAGARVELGVDATFTDAAPAPGDASLGGVALQVGIPTTADDHLEVAFELRQLQLPGAQQPRTFGLDASSLGELGGDVFELVLGLVRAQLDSLNGVDPALAPVRAVAGLLGLRDVAGLPPLPLAELPTRGVAAVVDWVESVLSVAAARDAWLGQLADLVGGTVLPAEDAVRVTAGPASVTVGVRVDAGPAGHPVLVPWAAVALSPQGPQAGVQARLAPGRDRRWRRGRCVQGRPGSPRLGGGVGGPGGDDPWGTWPHSDDPSPLGRGRWQLFGAAGQPHRAQRRTGAVHRLRYRRPGHAELADSAAQHTDRADRGRSARHRAQLPAHDGTCR
jgi:hypothetical protein